MCKSLIRLSFLLILYFFFVAKCICVEQMYITTHISIIFWPFKQSTPLKMFGWIIISKWSSKYLVALMPDNTFIIDCSWLIYVGDLPYFIHILFVTKKSGNVIYEHCLTSFFIHWYKYNKHLDRKITECLADP